MEEQFIERERENIGKKKKKFSRGIIRLNNVTDLIKIPINDLNSLDVNALKGNLYKKIYEEALKEEKSYTKKKYEYRIRRGKVRYGKFRKKK